MLGSVSYESEHKTQGALHGLIHELGQPHSHDHDNEEKFEISYSTEAIEHVQQDLDCCVVALVMTTVVELPDKKPSGAVIWYANNWSPPFIQHINPPPRF
ncbi:hypothetical protein [Psychrosphaera ytuae]|uniref:hypothetical protein n=1 Tax=Psychrosphaera ytuae TaxID=2820710 RepID=UPI001E3923FB|nr:hypothetical protein [Psychrosphaera ytuae]